MARYAYRSLLLVALLTGVAAGVFGKDLVHGNKDAVDLLVTVFSILAGFLVAIMSLLGGDLLPVGTWRAARAEKLMIRAKLIRQKWLFYAYLTTLALIFVSRLISAKSPTTAEVIEQLYFGLGTAAFVLSFGLPSALLQIQTTRMNQLVQQEKSRASVLDTN